MKTAEQPRTARAPFGVDQRKPAESANLSLPTIRRMQASQGAKRIAALGIEPICDHAASGAGGCGLPPRKRPASRC